MELILYLALGFVLIITTLIAARFLLPIALLYFLFAYAAIPVLSGIFMFAYTAITGEYIDALSWYEVIQIF